MAFEDLIGPRSRDSLLAIVAVVLVSAPLWMAFAFPVQPHRYERVEVTYGNGTELNYPSENVSRMDLPVSDDIACSGGLELRSCAFERHLLDGETVETSLHSPTSNYHVNDWQARYQYVELGTSVYRVDYVVNVSNPRDDGLYPVELALEPVMDAQALRNVSIPVDSHDLPGAVAAAARNGHARSESQVDVPETPIKVGNESYYRVRHTDDDAERSMLSGPMGRTLAFLAVLTGISIAVSLLTRVSITYEGGD